MNKVAGILQAEMTPMAKILAKYADFITHFPYIVVLISVGVCIYPSLIFYRDFVHIFTVTGFENPKLGFEARGTELSGRILAWNELQKQLDKEDSTVDKLLTRDPRSTNKKEWTALFQEALLSQPCNQLFEDKAFQYFDYFGQVIFEVKKDQLLSLPTLKELCEFERRLKPSLPFQSLPYKINHFWSLPNYATCISADPLNCSFLTEPHLKDIRQLLDTCGPFYDKIVSCRQQDVDISLVPDCQQINWTCHGRLATDLIYYILSNQFVSPDSDTVHINTYLPILTYEAYAAEQPYLARLSDYKAVYSKILELSAGMKTVRMKGVRLDMKYATFQEALFSDIRWGVLAVVLVVFFIFAYAWSFLYTLSVLLSLYFSFALAYCLYTYVFGIHFFPFMNLLAFVLLIGIGADDTFILNFIFSRAKSSQSEIDDLGRISAISVQKALSHSALSMFVTSLTTAAAFYANLFSSVVVVKCFGLFAGTMMLVNYLLVITLLPSILVLSYRYLNPGIRFVAKKCSKCFSWPLNIFARDSSPFQALIQPLTDKLLPAIVFSLRFVWVTLFSFLITGSLILIFYKPGLTLPSINPLQLFKDSHPFEWYDNNAELLFPSAANRSKIPVYIAIIWGVKPTKDASYFNPRDNGSLSLDPSFKWATVADLNATRDVCRQIHQLDLVAESSGHESCWVDRFFKWSRSRGCSQYWGHCCNVWSEHFNEEEDLPYCLRSAAQRLSAFWDGPIFNATSNALIGYTIEVESRYRYSGFYADLKNIVNTVDAQVNQALANSSSAMLKSGWPTTSWSYISIWFDLQHALLHDTPISVLISVTVALLVVVLSTWTLVNSVLAILTISGVILNTIAILVLVQWKINVVEATIIILTVGLSFDFTLHYAVAFKLAPKGSQQEKVSYAFQTIGVPVLLSALTTFVAGAAMLPSTTRAFYQIGLFMMWVTACSWLYSTFFFMSLLSIFCFDSAATRPTRWFKTISNKWRLFKTNNKVQAAPL